MLVYLVGYMGSGKSTVGRQLAKLMKYTFRDTDIMIENSYRVNVSRIFEKYGEDVFRKVEHNILQETASFQNTIVATGGGLPCFKDNMNFINSHGISVYIKLTPAQLCERLKMSKQKRPLLKNLDKKNLLLFVAEQLSRREGFYNRANVIFDPYSESINALINRILSCLYLEK